MTDRLDPGGVAVRHASVGLVCAALNIGIVHIGDTVLNWPYLLSASMTCFITIPTSYVLHRRHSFRVGRAASWPEFGRFGAQQALQFALGLLLLAACVEVLGLSPTWAMAASVAAMWLLSMAMQWRWVFRLPGPGRGA